MKQIFIFIFTLSTFIFSATDKNTPFLRLLKGLTSCDLNKDNKIHIYSANNKDFSKDKNNKARAELMIARKIIQKASGKFYVNTSISTILRAFDESDGKGDLIIDLNKYTNPETATLARKLLIKELSLMTNILSHEATQERTDLLDFIKRIKITK